MGEAVGVRVAELPLLLPPLDEEELLLDGARVGGGTCLDVGWLLLVAALAAVGVLVLVAVDVLVGV